jgi:hypothetical protein
MDEASNIHPMLAASALHPFKPPIEIRHKVPLLKLQTVFEPVTVNDSIFATDKTGGFAG